VTAQLQYSEAELMSDHPFAAPHVVDGRLMHGGMLSHGTYQPPRALVREAALTAWEHALRTRGGRTFPATAALLAGERVPTVSQSRVLLRNDLGQSFWNTLTITGKIEARGRALAEAVFPDLQQFIVDDISSMAIGHLNHGLLKAHGLDEGGEPERGIGGHDALWFVARDLAFGANAYPDADPEENIGRPEAGTRFMAEIPAAAEGLLSLLMNLLIIEFRAEIGFAATQQILRTPDLFADRREQAELAAVVVDRIRADEDIHVRSLCLYLGELQSVTFGTVDGGTIAGSELIDRFWDGLVHWATDEQPRRFAAQQLALIEQRIAAHTDAARVRREFHDAADSSMAAV
jgi:hypothetical protein